MMSKNKKYTVVKNTYSVLGAVILNSDLQPCWNVRYSNSAFRSVYVLPSGSTSSIYLCKLINFKCAFEHMPAHLYVSIFRSEGFSSNMPSSSISGSTATVAVEVCTRPSASVSGTRCTLCTPLSCLNFLNASAPLIRDTASFCSLREVCWVSKVMVGIGSFQVLTFMPPKSLVLRLNVSYCHDWDSAYFLYIFISSAAKSPASSPPAA